MYLHVVFPLVYTSLSQIHSAILPSICSTALQGTVLWVATFALNLRSSQLTAMKF